MTYPDSFLQVDTKKSYSYLMVSKDCSGHLLHEDCPVLQLIAIVGDKWTLPVLYVLQQGTKRYSELHREIPGISKKMLTQTLRRLESDRILKRKVYPVVPPKTEYNLTVFGRELIEPVQVLADWAWEHQAELKSISDRRQQTDSKKSKTANKKQN